ncbi:porin [Psychromonas sp. 14N.309.X.WAT.B.A12]|uniref:porin n=1 Tax=unclassified Psychromonas TaxID=2614957 RepID=UPI0025B0D5AD|nr:porin [Psychromonas sp. 14N.309.X.WAT.B.A12]MDN2664342.1 porin [Psychromonas sp. 14N.309.X.WAT.B.A12]
MKKTILATMLTSLFAATAAHSATVYEADGVTLDLFGDVEIQANKGTEDDAPKMIHLDDADFGVQAGYVLSDSLSAIAKISVTGEDETGSTNNIDLDEAFVGLSFTQFGTVTIGQQYTIADDIGIANDYAFGINSGYAGVATDGKQVVKYVVDNGNYYFGISYLLNENAASDDVESIDARLGVRIDELDLTAYLGKADDADASATSVLLEARYTMDDLALAASVSSLDGYTSAEDSTAFGLAAAYTVDKVTYSGGYSLLDVDGDEDKLNTYFVNAAYAFNSNVTVYAELGGDDSDDSELGYGAGMAVTF